MDVYIAGEGYNLPTGFILKEACIMFSNKEYTQYLFKGGTIGLGENEFKAIRKAMKTTNKLSFHDGDTSPYQFADALDRYKDYTIYTYSEVMQKYIQHHLPTTLVINTQDTGLILSDKLPDPGCFRHHPPRFCAKAKVIAIRDFIENNPEDNKDSWTW